MQKFKKKKVKTVSALFLKGSLSISSVMHCQVCSVDKEKGDEYSISFFVVVIVVVFKGRSRQSRTCRSSWRKRCHGKLQVM